MARVHLFTSSTTPHHERRRQSLSPEHSIADDAPSPSTENITIAANATPTHEDVSTVDVDAVAAAAAAASPSTVNMSQASLSTPASPLASHEQQQHDLASSTAALTAALLQSAHGHEDVSNAVAAALSGKSGKQRKQREREHAKLISRCESRFMFRISFTATAIARAA